MHILVGLELTTYLPIMWQDLISEYMYLVSFKSLSLIIHWSVSAFIFLPHLNKKRINKPVDVRNMEKRILCRESGYISNTQILYRE
jgi:hypothetical protein